MKVLFIVHVGETLGHLARAITIAREFERRDCIVECVGHKRGEQFWIAARLKGRFHPVTWDWSHNETEPSAIRPEMGAKLLQSVRHIREVVERCQPDYILGMPGFASAQLARLYGIPHSSVLHGVHLAPLIRLENPTSEERAVLDLTTRICVGALNNAFQLVTEKLSFPAMTYQEFVDTENIFVTQPGLPFQHKDNMRVTSFVRGSLGEALPDSPRNASDAVFVTFGSGNPCNINRVLLLAKRVFANVIASTGNGPVPMSTSGVQLNQFIAIADVARRVQAVVSHGGIGTVGTFAEYGLPQLIMPTEIDQANMAIHARRSGLAQSVGLGSFVSRTTLGRRLPEFSDDEFLDALRRLKTARASRVPANGAETIVDKICAAERCTCE